MAFSFPSSSRSEKTPRWEEGSGNPSCIGFDEDEKLLKSGSLESSGQIITTSAEVTLNAGLVGESPQNPLNSGLGINTNLPRIMESCHHKVLEGWCRTFSVRKVSEKKYPQDITKTTFDRRPYLFWQLKLQFSLRYIEESPFVAAMLFRENRVPV